MIRVNTAAASVIAIHGIHGSYRTTWCTPEADGRGLGPLLSKLASFSRIFTYDGDIQETVLFKKSGLEKAATDLLKSMNMHVDKEVTIVERSALHYVRQLLLLT